MVPLQGDSPGGPRRVVWTSTLRWFRSIPNRLPSLSWLGTLVVALLLLELVATGLDLLLGPYGDLHWEERINAINGMHLLSGHLPQIWDLQYMPNCGGCTANSLLAAGLYWLLEPTVLVYRLVPVGFHFLLCLAGAALAWRMAGRRGALVFVLLMMSEPALFRELTLTGWGNHAESRFFPFLAALLLSVPRPGRRAWPWLGLAGLCTGLGFWYCNTTAIAFPALLVLLLLRPRPLLTVPPFCLGACAGLVPWVLHALHDARVDWLAFMPAEHDWVATFEALPRWLAGENLLGALWTEDGGLPRGLFGPRLYWYGLWGLALGGAGVASVLACLSWWRAPRRPPSPSLAPGARTGSLLLFGPLALAGLLAAYLLRSDLWLGSVFERGAMGFRYLSPVIPLLVICAAATQARKVPAVPRHLLLAAAIATAGWGIAQRAGAWGPLRGHLLGQSILDRGVPTSSAVFSHGDRGLAAHLAEVPGESALCRGHHLYVLGMGWYGSQGDYDAVEVLQVARTATERRFLLEGFAEGMAREVHAAGHCGPDSVEDLLQGRRRWLGSADDSALDVVLVETMLDAAGQSCDTRGWGAELTPRHDLLERGLCRFRGQAALRELVLEQRTRKPSPEQIEALVGGEGRCQDEPSFAYGLGWGWARWVACTPRASANLIAWAVPDATREVRAGLDAGCVRYRPSVDRTP